MDYMFDAYVGYDIGEVDDIPKNAEEVWILAKKYSFDELEKIREDVLTKLWCTYRRGFVEIGGEEITSDKGWGCMLRCGQMVLAQALIMLHLGRDWRWTTETKDLDYLNIVNRFEDNRKSTYSIHQIALMGEGEDKKVGEWFSPNTVAQVFKKLVKFDDNSSLVCHSALDNVLATNEVLDLCVNPTTLAWKPILLFIPLRLGLTDINPIYIESLKKTFEFEGSLGLIGGKPNQALYFIGYVGEEALYLDPHTVQRSGSVGAKETQNEQEMDETYHQKYATRIGFKSIDPSLALCFICKTKEEFENLVRRFKEEINDVSGMQPLFEITEKRCLEWVSSCTEADLVGAVGLSEEFEDIKKNQGSDDDDFEIIC